MCGIRLAGVFVLSICFARKPSTGRWLAVRHYFVVAAWSSARRANACATGRFEMALLGDSLRGERACPSCRRDGALCARHAQMYSELRSPTPNSMAEVASRSDHIERSVAMKGYQARYQARRRAEAAAVDGAAAVDDDGELS